MDLGGEGEGGLDIDEAALEQGEEQSVFAGEMGVEKSRGEAGFGSDGFYGGAGEAVAGEEQQGGVEEAGAGGGTEELILGGGAGHRPIID